jgi:hypothetical protein
MLPRNGLEAQNQVLKARCYKYIVAIPGSGHILHHMMHRVTANLGN